MSTGNEKRNPFFAKMVVRLWLIMMILVLFTVGIMWVMQIFILEQNYSDMTISQIQERLQPIMEEVATEDLAYNENLVSNLSWITNGKMLVVNEDGKLMAMYSHGCPIDLAGSEPDAVIWEDIQNDEVYQSVLKREEYSREIREGSHVIIYEVGVPVLYDGEPAYVILRQSFGELYQVLKLNRQHLIILSILLVLISSVLAACLSRKFIMPIHVIKETVDQLAEGNLEATPNLNLKDEAGQLALSVEKLGIALQRVDNLRKEVIANVSHELRSPLSLIGGYAEMIRDIHWREEEKREEDLNLIIRESKRMSEMVSDILDYSQLQAGYLQLHKDWYNPYEIVESEILFCRQGAQQYHISLQFSFCRREIAVYADALKISRVIRNLLYNAINHTKDGRVILIDITEDNTGWQVAVKNAGDPIPVEERKLIWERYQRSQHQGGRKEGTGLGLSIVRAILEAHGLPYGVDYQNGMTVFWFQCLKEERGDKREENKSFR